MSIACWVPAVMTICSGSQRTARAARKGNVRVMFAAIRRASSLLSNLAAASSQYT
jgi:hypothetical protein